MFSEDDIKQLAVASDGNCCHIMMLKDPWQDDYNSPDILHFIREEIIEPNEVLENPQSLSDIASKIITDHSSASLVEQCTLFCEEMKLSEGQRDQVASRTKGQSTNIMWTEFRKGMITASRVLAVKRKIDETGAITNPDSTDNLIASMLQYKKQVQTKAMKWGIVNEPYVREQYCREIKKEHKHFSLSETGLVLSTEHRYLGASPDAVVSCNCCGKGVAEFKVTWFHREKSVDEFAKIPGTCLHFQHDRLQLKRSHEYFYQVQMQMLILHVKYAGFYLTILLTVTEKKFTLMKNSGKKYFLNYILFLFLYCSRAAYSRLVNKTYCTRCIGVHVV